MRSAYDATRQRNAAQVHRVCICCGSRRRLLFVIRGVDSKRGPDPTLVQPRAERTSRAASHPRCVCVMARGDQGPHAGAHKTAWV